MSYNLFELFLIFLRTDIKKPKLILKMNFESIYLEKKHYLHYKVTKL